jgi:hypothetical protein
MEKVICLYFLEELITNDKKGFFLEKRTSFFYSHYSNKYKTHF